MLGTVAFFLFVLINVSVLASVDYCNIKTCPQPYAHTMCKFKSGNPAGACSTVFGVGLTKKETNDILNYHNTMRQIVASGKEIRGKPGPQPAALKMAVLVWDDELARVAQRWANQCIWAHDSCRDVANSLVGQNIGYVGTTGNLSEVSMMDIVKAWYDEVKDFDKNQVKSLRAPVNHEPDVGHYTQFVWAETTRIGCGAIKHVNGSFKDVFGVCNYEPTGNWINQPIYPTKN